MWHTQGCPPSLCCSLQDVRFHIALSVSACNIYRQGANKLASSMQSHLRLAVEHLLI